MASLTGPYIEQIVSKPVIEIADSKKFDEGVTLKINGSNGSGEFTVDEVVNIYSYIQDFLKMKGLDPSLESAANRLLDQSYLGSSLREGESITITHN